jgi:RNA 2',3'-cyclic 3'-phosphodiesterase
MRRDNDPVILFAAIVPPLSALQTLDDYLRGNGTGPSGLRSPENVHFVIARFGNTTLGDAKRLIDALTAAAEDWSAPSGLSLGGGQVVDTPAERTLEVEVHGDLERLTGLAGDVRDTAQHLRFLLDRRAFRPFITLATASTTSDSGMDAAATALDAFEGESWQVTHLSMRKQTYGSGGDSEEVGSIPLVGA